MYEKIPSVDGHLREREFVWRDVVVCGAIKGRLGRDDEKGQRHLRAIARTTLSPRNLHAFVTTQTEVRMPSPLSAHCKVGSLLAEPFHQQDSRHAASAPPHAFGAGSSTRRTPPSPSHPSEPEHDARKVSASESIRMPARTQRRKTSSVTHCSTFASSRRRQRRSQRAANPPDTLDASSRTHGERYLDSLPFSPDPNMLLNDETPRHPGCPFPCTASEITCDMAQRTPQMQFMTQSLSSSNRASAYCRERNVVDSEEIGSWDGEDANGVTVSVGRAVWGLTRSRRAFKAWIYEHRLRSYEFKEDAHSTSKLQNVRNPSHSHLLTPIAQSSVVASFAISDPASHASSSSRFLIMAISFDLLSTSFGQSHDYNLSQSSGYVVTCLTILLASCRFARTATLNPGLQMPSAICHRLQFISRRPPPIVQPDVVASSNSKTPGQIFTRLPSSIIAFESLSTSFDQSNDY
ncbi:hypothetical protein SCHPADRAFT_892929 [Schizopora paradoxa]|uniref:Uncharacterized protein n=1 Tax=Schizopora paradoxa TaxID=27342 RepID=A0A0H2RCZ3_9AGAM|nr:hypothetical protein SCHPADRAFT_892929 [Schizopora paradoxa]